MDAKTSGPNPTNYVAADNTDLACLIRETIITFSPELCLEARLGQHEKANNKQQ